MKTLKDFLDTCNKYKNVHFVTNEKIPPITVKSKKGRKRFVPPEIVNIEKEVMYMNALWNKFEYLCQHYDKVDVNLYHIMNSFLVFYTDPHNRYVLHYADFKFTWALNRKAVSYSIYGSAGAVKYGNVSVSKTGEANPDFIIYFDKQNDKKIEDSQLKRMPFYDIATIIDQPIIRQNVISYLFKFKNTLDIRQINKFKLFGLIPKKLEIRKPLNPSTYLNYLNMIDNVMPDMLKNVPVDPVYVLENCHLEKFV